MGRGQVVRHRFLVSAFAGSNPAAPASCLNCSNCDLHPPRKGPVPVFRRQACCSFPEIVSRQKQGKKTGNHEICLQSRIGRIAKSSTQKSENFTALWFPWALSGLSIFFSPARSLIPDDPGVFRGSGVFHDCGVLHGPGESFAAPESCMVLDPLTPLSGVLPL